MVAEALGLRRGDSFRGVKSIEERRAMVAGCTDSLFSLIAQTHDVEADTARAAPLERNLLLDVVLVLLPMIILLRSAAAFFFNRVRQRFLPDEPASAFIATVLMALVVVGMWWLVGEMWSWLVEMLRLRDDHISYRAARLPWYRFGAALFGLGVVVFSAVVWRRWRSASPGTITRA